MPSVSRETDNWTTRSDETILLQGAERLNIALSPPEAGLLLEYLNQLEKWNRKINLIGPASRKERIVIHLVDSLSPLAHLDFSDTSFADLGSGGGLPGLVLKLIRPGWNGALIEAKGKKAAFLRQVIRNMALDRTEVIEGRLGGGSAKQFETRYDLVVMRGFSSLRDALEPAINILKPEGLVLAYKGPKYRDELEKALECPPEYRLELEKVVEYRLPFLNRKRSLLFLRHSPV